MQREMCHRLWSLYIAHSAGDGLFVAAMTLSPSVFHKKWLKEPTGARCYNHKTIRPLLNNFIYQSGDPMNWKQLHWKRFDGNLSKKIIPIAVIVLALDRK